MQEGKRPGGLTALAIFNFVGAGLDVLKVLGLIATMLLAGKMADTMERELQERDEPEASERSEDADAAIAALRGFERVGRPAYFAWLALIAACGSLLVTAGVGYLRQRRWGRVVGTVYALLSIATTSYAMVIIPAESGGGLRFASLLAFVYPLLTLTLVHTTFRADFGHG